MLMSDLKQKRGGNLDIQKNQPVMIRMEIEEQVAIVFLFVN